MTKKILLCCLGPLAIAACGSAGKGGEQSAEEVAKEMAKLNSRPGQWQVTNEVLSANAPSLPAPAVQQMIGNKTSTEACMTQEEAKNPGAKFLLGQKNMDCTYQGFSVSDGIMKGTINCAMPGVPGRTVMKVDGKYSPVAYDMNMDMDVAIPGGAKMMVKARTIGRRTGECT